MKKLISLVAVAILSVTALFAAENTFHVGLPIANVTGYSDDVTWFGNDSSSNGITCGLYADYVRVFDGKFTFKAEASFAGPFTQTGIGLGFSPLADAKKTLSLFGDIGFGKPNIFSVGTDVMFTYRFTEKWGAFADVGWYLGTAFVAKLGGSISLSTR